MNPGTRLRHLAVSLTPFLPYPYEGRSEACVLCDERDGLVVSEHDRRLKRLRTLACTGCGLLRTDPMPTEVELEEYYRHSYRADYQLVGRTPPRRQILRSRREATQRANFLSAVLPPNASVLDYGSGSGEFLLEGAQRGWIMLGVERGEAYRRHAAAQGAEVHAALPGEAGPFDVITSHHVLEHLRDPLATLKRLAASLQPGGIVYLAVPHMGPASKPAFERLDFARIHGFVPATLDLLAAKAGLVPDPRFLRDGTTAFYCLGSSDMQPDPALAAHVRAGFNPSTPLRHVLTLGWAAPTVRRLSRDVCDTLEARH